MNGSAFFVFFIIVAVATLIFGLGRPASILENWAAEQGYRILSSERRAFRRGPFFFTTVKGQVVYRISVEDRDGHVKEGYVRCGSYLLGTFSDKVDVRWDAEPPHRPGFPVVLKDREDRDDA